MKMKTLARSARKKVRGEERESLFDPHENSRSDFK
jgi:hypothetical protein